LFYLPNNCTQEKIAQDLRGEFRPFIPENQDFHQEIVKKFYNK